MFVLFTLFVLQLTPDAYAQACNAKNLKKELAAAVPQEIPGAWGKLRDCDTNAAKAEVKASLDRAIPGPATDKLIPEMLAVGADDAVRVWISALPPDERARTLAALGNTCDNTRVAEFLAGSAAALGDKFWNERWYRSLSSCRAPAVTTLLEAELRKAGGDRSRFFSVLEVYARNLGKDSIPMLKELGGSLNNEEELIYLINAFSDAAGVGSVGGTNTETANEAVAAIVELAPRLPPRAIESARTTLLSLGAEPEANKLAGLRYADRAWEDGQLHYGVVVVENATCKKGAIYLGIHVGELQVAGDAWPDQVAAQIAGAAESGWTYDIARKCKGTGSNTVFVTPEPIKAADLKAWQDEQVREAQKTPAKKQTLLPEALPLKL